MAKLSHHYLKVHLNLNPEIFIASPQSTYDWHIPTTGTPGSGEMVNCGNLEANSFHKRKEKSDNLSSKKRKMNPSFSLEQFFLGFLPWKKRFVTNWTNKA